MDPSNIPQEEGPVVPLTVDVQGPVGSANTMQWLHGLVHQGLLAGATAIITSAGQ